MTRIKEERFEKENISDQLKEVNDRLNKEFKRADKLIDKRNKLNNELDRSDGIIRNLLIRKIDLLERLYN